MAVFYVLMLVPLAMQHFTTKSQSIDYEKKNRQSLFIFFFLLAVIVGLRHQNVGNDTRNYIYYFEQYSEKTWLELSKMSVEFGFAYFNKFVSIFTQVVNMFFLVTAFVTFAMIYITYKRLCTDSSLTIVLYVTMSTFVMAFSGIRQMLAIGLGFVAYELTRNKKLIPFILMVVLAITVHTSAFMLLFMYPIYHAKITKKWLYIVVPVITLIFVFNNQIFSTLSMLLETFTEYNTSKTDTGAYAMLILFVIFAVFAFLIPDEAALDKETIGLRNFLLFSLVLQMFAPLHSLAMRMNYYYIIFIPLLIPKIIKARSERWGQIAIFARHIMVVFFLVYFFYNAYVGDNNLHVFPYKFFWEAA